MGKSTISMAIFNSYVNVYQRVVEYRGFLKWWYPQNGWFMVNNGKPIVYEWRILGKPMLGNLLISYEVGLYSLQIRMAMCVCFIIPSSTARIPQFGPIPEPTAKAMTSEFSRYMTMGVRPPCSIET